MEFILRQIGLTSTIPQPSGPYKVGVIPLRLKDCCFTKIFYPASGERATEKILSKVSETFGYNTEIKGPYRYARKKVIEGTASWTQRPLWNIKWTIGFTNFFYHYCSPFLPKKSFPLVIFSHGLGGNADIYSKMCSDIASYGYVVVALEHEDGSGSYAFDNKTKKDIFYKSLGNTDCRDQLIKQRKPFLSKRVAEIHSIIESLSKSKVSGSLLVEEGIDESLEKDLLNSFILTKLYLAGHSFGGATVVSAMNDTRVSDRVTAVVCFDIWSSPVDKEDEKKGINVPALSIVGEGFLACRSYRITKSIFSNSPQSIQFSLNGVTHAQFSDGPWFMGNSYLKRKPKLEGRMPGVVSQEKIMKLVSRFLETGIEFEYRECLDEEMILVDKSKSSLIKS